MDNIINNIREILISYIDEIVDDQVNVLNISNFSKNKLKNMIFELIISYVNINNIIDEYYTNLSLYFNFFDDTIYYDEFERVCRQLIPIFVR